MRRGARSSSPRWGLACCAALLAGCVGTSLEREVDAALTELQTCPDLAGGRIGVLVVDAASGVELARAMAGHGFAPASNNKLLTSAVALQSLGPDHRMRTSLFARGEVVDGRLLGDLVLVGGGDPTFAEAELADAQWRVFAEGLRGLGIERVAGRVVGDASWQAAEPRGHGWQWDYLDDDYAAPFGGLCAAGNVIELRISSADDGARVKVAPELADVEAWVANEVVRSEGEGDELVVRRGLGRQRVVVSGRIGAGRGPQRRRRR